MSGYVCLHLHYLPGVDDGVRDAAEGLALCRELQAIGFEHLVTTPHIRTAMFENDALGLRDYLELDDPLLMTGEELPTLGLGAEHHFDDAVWERLVAGEGLSYPGGHALLVELPEAHMPEGLRDRFYRLRVRGQRVVLAHPERYRVFFERTHAMDPLLDAGALPLLDVMSLVGRYGRVPQRAAERMVEEGTYYAACTDAHRPADAETVARGIDRLRELVGDDEVQQLLSTNPRHILAGTAEYD